MTIKNIIKKLEKEMRRADITGLEWLNLDSWNKGFYAGIETICKDTIKWIKSNLEEEQAKYGKDYDDWRESKIAEERENQG